MRSIEKLEDNVREGLMKQEMSLAAGERKKAMVQIECR